MQHLRIANYIIFLSDNGLQIAYPKKPFFFPHNTLAVDERFQSL
jgi:hypothetical protein